MFTHARKKNSTNNIQFILIKAHMSTKHLIMKQKQIQTIYFKNVKTLTFLIGIDASQTKQASKRSTTVQFQLMAYGAGTTEQGDKMRP